MSKKTRKEMAKESLDRLTRIKTRCDILAREIKSKKLEKGLLRVDWEIFNSVVKSAEIILASTQQDLIYFQS